GYDAHFIIKELSTQFQGTIKLLPINKKNTFLLLNMLQAQALGKLSSNLQNEQKSITKLFCNTEE
ncbi:unnamed protein product, partial [Tenebrio molitor]